MPNLTKEQVLEALKSVKDPEIPTVSLVDLGLIETIQIEADRIYVEMIPTFAGCPALEYMRKQVEERLKELGFTEVTVVMNRNKPWSTDRITPEGLQAIHQFGLGLPQNQENFAYEKPVTCPKCGSSNTKLVSLFGPTLCRAIHHCNDCQETFEQFKAV